MNTTKTSVTAASSAREAASGERSGAASGGRAASGGLRAHLRYEFLAGEQRGAALSNPLFELLAAITEAGSITHAARAMGRSYRYVWDALRKWESVLGEPLVSWSQGRKARPTPFAEQLVWAERRARLRMQPQIEELRSDLSQVLAAVTRDSQHQLLRVCASHDLALPVLQRYAASTQQLHLELRFQGSFEALQALNDHRCLIAGLHFPVLRMTDAAFTRQLYPRLRSGVHELIACSHRLQGIMVRKEHVPLVQGFPDLARHRLRFVNRQPGSGTRLLVEQLMRQHALSPTQLAGYNEQVENTHVSVALCVASGVADAGIGIEAAALQFGLHFVPLVEENYFLACLATSVQHPAVTRLRGLLAGERWQEILAGLPGYRLPVNPGGLVIIDEALPWCRSGRRDRCSHQG